MVKKSGKDSSESPKGEKPEKPISLEIAGEVTPEQIGYQLWKKEQKDFSTEIKNPSAMSSLESYADYNVGFAGNIVTELLKGWIAYDKVNWIAKDRKRSAETVDMFKALKEMEAKTAKQKLLGEKEG